MSKQKIALASLAYINILIGTFNPNVYSAANAIIDGILSYSLFIYSFDDK